MLHAHPRSASSAWSLGFVDVLLQPETLKPPSPWFVNEHDKMPVLWWCFHSIRLRPCRMKEVNMPHISLLLRPLSSVHLIQWRQELELLISPTSQMHTLKHFIDTDSSGKWSHSLIFGWDGSYCGHIWSASSLNCVLTLQFVWKQECDYHITDKNTDKLPSKKKK